MCAAGPFQSAASSLVDEGAHPVLQLQVLDEKAADHEALGDTDAVIECRIKQLALQRLLCYLYDFPIQALVRAEITLAEAYATGMYLKQADEHLARAREVIGGGIYDDAQCQRMQVDVLIAEGTVQLAKDQADAAHRSLMEAARLTREAYGDMDIRSARIQNMLGLIAQQRGRYVDAIDHFSAAWEVREYVNGAQAEETVRLRLRIAEAQYLHGQAEEAISTQNQIIEKLQQTSTFPALLVDASTQLARWYEAQNNDPDALKVLQAVEKTVCDNLGPENAKAVAIKSDIALLHLKLGDHNTALQYLNDVHYFERCLHGSQSINVARTLKALGTVHMVKRNVGDAEQCLYQALRIFEVDYPLNTAIIRDIHSKLASITSMSNPRPAGGSPGKESSAGAPSP